MREIRKIAIAPVKVLVTVGHGRTIHAGVHHNDGFTHTLCGADHRTNRLGVRVHLAGPMDSGKVTCKKCQKRGQ